MSLNIIDKPGPKGSAFFDLHEQIALTHQQFALGRKGQFTGKYGCLEVETFMTFELEGGSVKMTQHRSLQSIGGYLHRTKYVEITEIKLMGFKELRPFIIKPKSFWRLLFGKYKTISGTGHVHNRGAEQHVFLSTAQIKWLHQQKVFQINAEAYGVLCFKFSSIHQTKSELEMVVDFCANLIAGSNQNMAHSK